MKRTLWRVFPWDEEADPGAPFSAPYLPPQSGLGRFDLPARLDASAYYLAESAEHAVAEKIQDLRNGILRDEFLFERGRRLASCEVVLDGNVRVADLCEPHELAARKTAPDRLASRRREITRPVAERLHGDPDLVGFRWWSAFSGDWHTVVLFSDRLPEGGLVFSTPDPLHLGTPHLIRAASALGIEIVDA